MRKADTYRFASVSGDARFVGWIYDRLLFVYHDNHLFDYMHTLKALELGINECVRKAEAYERLPRIVRWMWPCK